MSSQATKSASDSSARIQRPNRASGSILGALRAAVADPAQVLTRALDLHAGAHDA